jgi:hypothetical protein
LGRKQQVSYLVCFKALRIEHTIVREQSYLLKPGQLGGGQLVAFGMVEDSFLQLGINGFKLLKGGLLSHGGRSGGLEGGGDKKVQWVSRIVGGKRNEVEGEEARIINTSLPTFVTTN